MEAKPSRWFTSYCIGLFGLAAAVAVALACAGESPKITQVLILGVLFAIEDNMDVDLGDGVGLSASIMIVIAAIVLGLIIWLVQQIPGVAQFAQIIRVVAIAIFVIYCIYILMELLGSGHVPALK